MGALLPLLVALIVLAALLFALRRRHDARRGVRFDRELRDLYGRSHTRDVGEPVERLRDRGVS